MFRVCIASVQNVERSLSLLVVSVSDIPLRTIKFFLYFLHFTTYRNMRLIQFNIYLNHHFNNFMLNYITYVVRCVCTHGTTKFVAYVQYYTAHNE